MTKRLPLGSLAIWLGLCASASVLTLWEGGPDSVWRLLLLILTTNFGVIALSSHGRPAGRFGSWFVLASLAFLSLGYVVKYSAFLLGRESAFASMAFQALFPSWTRGVSDRTVTEALLATTMAFGGLAIAAVALRAGRPKSFLRPPESHAAGPATRRTWLAVLVAGFLVFFVSSALRWRYQLHVLGSQAGLPPGAAGVVNLTNRWVGPWLLTLAVLFAAQEGRYRLARKLAAVSVAAGFLQFLLFWSKASFLMPIVLAGLCHFAAYRKIFSTRDFVVVAALAALVYPFMNVYRSLRAAELVGFLGVQQVVESGLAERFDSTGPLGLLSVSLASLVGRVIGFESLMTALEYRWTSGSFILGALNFAGSSSVDRVFTQEVLGINRVMGVSPGLLGRMILLTGSLYAVIPGVALVTYGVGALSEALSRGADPVRRGAGALVFFVGLVWLISGPRLLDVLWFGFSLVTTAVLARLAIRLIGRPAAENR